MRLVAYTRVSTEGQVSDGLGLDVQEKAIREWARKAGHRILAVRSDAAKSGTKDLAERTGLGEALADVSDGRAEAVAVYKLDRLARDLVLQEQLLAEFWRAGGEVFSTAGGEQDIRNDPEDPSRKLIRQVLGAVSEYERDMIVLRLRRGRALKHDRGGYAYGSPPFGWHSVEVERAGRKTKTLTPLEREQAGRRRIIELHREGKSLRQIIDIVTDEGLHPKRVGSRWHPSTVRRVIQRAEAS